MMIDILQSPYIQSLPNHFSFCYKTYMVLHFHFRRIAKFDAEEKILYISVLDALQRQNNEEVNEDN